MLRISVILTALALGVLAVGCDQEDATTPLPTPIQESATAQTATAEPKATAAPTLTPIETATSSAAGESHPSDAFFVLDRVLDISIEIDPEDWNTLRHQTRTFEDLLEEIETYGLSRPFANIYTWFSARVTVGGETHDDVGIRKKGFLGSQSDTKPSMKLRFDKYVDEQALGGVIQRMTLNNSIQDTSKINTCLAYQVFAAAGSPAPRCNFATVSVNGKDLGVID